MANTNGTVKETPVQYAARKRANALRLTDKFRKSMPDGYGKVESGLLDYEEIETDEVDRVKKLAEKLLDLVTEGRVAQIRRLVERSVKAWNDGKYAVPFAATTASLLVGPWLDSKSAVGKELDWVDTGWRLLKGDLEFPWGKCLCGAKLLPVNITDKRTGEKKWCVFNTCRSCHQNLKVENDVVEAIILAAKSDSESEKHKVKKPGSAAKRSHGPRPKKETQPKPEKKKKEVRNK